MTRTYGKPHLLIIRLSAMGDVAMVAPVVKALREAHPDLTITILTRSFFRPFFRDIENIGFLDADFKGRHKGMGGLIRLWRDVTALGVTHVADLHDVLRTQILRRLLVFSGQKYAKIDKGRDEKRELTRKFRKEIRPLKHTVERYRETINSLGFDFPSPVPAVRTTREIPAEIKKITGDKQGIWIGVAPFAKHKGKIYPPNLTDELIGLLAEKYDKVFIFGGGPYEKEFAEHMERCYPSVISMIGKIKLEAEMDMIANLDVSISMDSSAMHMGSLEGVPVVSVWGATHPYAGFYGFGQDPDNAVQLSLPCRPCSVYGDRACMYKDYRCLSNITPQSVADKVAEVLAGTDPEN